MKLLFLDTETTGLDPDIHGMIEIAGIVEIEGVVKKEFCYKMKPFKGQMINQKALATNGYKADDIKDWAEPLDIYKEIVSDFNEFIDPYNKRDKFHMVGQNPSFDYEFLNEFFFRNNNNYLYSYIHYHKIDLVAITATFKLAGLLDVENAKLSVVSEALGFQHTAHKAMDDTKMVQKIFHYYIDKLRSLK